jgi:hypothetical protein
LEDRLGGGEGLVDGLAATGGQLRGVLAVRQQRRGSLDGGLFGFGYPRPGLQAEAASCSASGSPSSRRHSSATASAFWLVNDNPGSTSRARSTSAVTIDGKHRPEDVSVLGAEPLGEQGRQIASDQLAQLPGVGELLEGRGAFGLDALDIRLRPGSLAGAGTLTYSSRGLPAASRSSSSRLEMVIPRPTQPYRCQ